jgi:TRAP-type C4-dicarboxylate transport system substrate-binding protein
MLDGDWSSDVCSSDLKLDEESVEVLKKAGVTYVVPDKEAFRKVLAEVHKPFEGKAWPAGLVEKVRAAQ